MILAASPSVLILMHTAGYDNTVVVVFVVVVNKILSMFFPQTLLALHMNY